MTNGETMMKAKKKPGIGYLRMPLLALALGATSAFAGPGRVASDMVVVVPEGTAHPAALSTQVEAWRKALGPDNVVWVDSLKREKPSGFGSMAVLHFPGQAQMAAWQQANAAALAAPLQLSIADVLTQGGKAPPASAKPMYKISYYTLNSPREAMQAWVDGYLTRYLDAQVDHGILTRYAMYLERNAGGRALLVLEYTDARTEQEAEPIKARLSEDIARVDKEYARQSALKEELRTTQSWTLAAPAH